MDLCETKFDSLLSALKIEDKMDHLSDIGDIVEMFKFYVKYKENGPNFIPTAVFHVDTLLILN